MSSSFCYAIFRRNDSMEENIYEKKSVNALIMYFSVPAILSLIVEIMASVVDTAFAGHLGSISVDALTAMGLLTPVLNLFTAVQALFAVSTSVFIAKYLNQKKERGEYFFAGITMTLVCSALLSGVFLLTLEDVLHLLGAKEQVFTLAKSYLQIQLISNLFSAMGYTLTSCIRAFGYPKVEMCLTTLAVFVNILFNAVFVFGFHLGFAGLAYGTLVSEIFCAVGACLWFLAHHLMPGFFHLSLRRFGSCTGELMKLGIAQTVIQAMGGCTSFFINHSLMLHMGNAYVAVWNVVQNIYTLLLMPTVGITQGVQTILAYFSGQGKEKEKQQAIRSTMVGTILYGLLAALGVFLFGDRLLSLFVDSSQIVKLAGIVLKIVFVSFPLMGVFYTIMTLLEVTEHELKAVGLILTRQVFLMIPLVYLLPILFPHLPVSVFLAVPIADMIAMVTAVMLSRISNQ